MNRDSCTWDAACVCTLDRPKSLMNRHMRAKHTVQAVHSCDMTGIRMLVEIYIEWMIAYLLRGWTAEHLDLYYTSTLKVPLNTCYAVEHGLVIIAQAALCTADHAAAAVIVCAAGTTTRGCVADGWIWVQPSTLVLTR
eukprot:GHRR01023302.1.p1 GENE.GHRR01023302.1~~GHRR01023302.1.p1  ORF type:complete len:138 (-),score=10.26 GHRR01023302.1:467-880(-)